MKLGYLKLMETSMKKNTIHHPWDRLKLAGPQGSSSPGTLQLFLTALAAHLAMTESEASRMEGK